MLKIRLQRIGRRNDPAYRLVLIDQRRGPKSNDFVEILGSYDHRVDKPRLEAEKIREWIGKGAQPSDTVHNLLVQEGVIEGKKINNLPQKSPVIDEEAIKAEAEAKEKAEAEAKAALEAKAAEEAEAAAKPEEPAAEAPAVAEEPKEESKPEEVEAEKASA